MTLYLNQLDGAPFAGTTAAGKAAQQRGPDMRFFESIGGTIMCRDGRTVATVDVANLKTAEALQITQVILAALNAQKDTTP